MNAMNMVIHKNDINEIAEFIISKNNNNNNKSQKEKEEKEDKRKIIFKIQYSY